MFDLQQTAQDLEHMLTDIAMKSGIFVPINRDTIKYKNYLITRDSPSGWNVFHLQDRKRHLGNTFLKVSAFAVVKLHEKRQQHRIDEIFRNDAIFQKNYVDSIYYKNTIKKAKDSQTKDTALWRFEIAHDKAKRSKRLIDGIFYSSIV
jgi:hypothetical protein